MKSEATLLAFDLWVNNDFLEECDDHQFLSCEWTNLHECLPGEDTLHVYVFHSSFKPLPHCPLRQVWDRYAPRVERCPTQLEFLLLLWLPRNPFITTMWRKIIRVGRSPLSTFLVGLSLVPIPPPTKISRVTSSEFVIGPSLCQITFGKARLCFPFYWTSSPL